MILLKVGLTFQEKNRYQQISCNWNLVCTYIYKGYGELGVNLFQSTIETCPIVSKLEQNYNYTRALVWKIAKGPSMVQNCIPFTQGCIVPSSDRNGRMVLELIERLYIWVKWDNYLSFERDLPFGQTTFIYLKKSLVSCLIEIDIYSGSGKEIFLKCLFNFNHGT